MVAAAPSSPSTAASTTSPKLSKTWDSTSSRTAPPSPTLARGLWSQEEHERFLEGMKMFPNGPVRFIAAHVGTRSVRQVQTHTQKYQEKVSRRLRGLRKTKKHLTRPEHRIDDDAMALCRLASAAMQQASAPKRTMNLQPLLNAAVLETESQPASESTFRPEERRVAPYTV